MNSSNVTFMDLYAVIANAHELEPKRGDRRESDRARYVGERSGVEWWAYVGADFELMCLAFDEAWGPNDVRGDEEPFLDEPPTPFCNHSGSGRCSVCVDGLPNGAGPAFDPCGTCGGDPDPWGIGLVCDACGRVDSFGTIPLVALEPRLEGGRGLEARSECTHTWEHQSAWLVGPQVVIAALCGLCGASASLNSNGTVRAVWRASRRPYSPPVVLESAPIRPGGGSGLGRETSNVVMTTSGHDSEHREVTEKEGLYPPSGEDRGSRVGRPTGAPSGLRFRFASLTEAELDMWWDVVALFRARESVHAPGWQNRDTCRAAIRKLERLRARRVVVFQVLERMGGVFQVLERMGGVFQVLERMGGV